MIASGTFPPVVQALMVHCAAWPRSVTACGRETSTQRLTLGSFCTALAPLCGSLDFDGVGVGVACGWPVGLAVAEGVPDLLAVGVGELTLADLLVLGVGDGEGVPGGEGLADADGSGLVDAVDVADAFGVLDGLLELVGEGVSDGLRLVLGVALDCDAAGEDDDVPVADGVGLLSAGVGVAVVAEGSALGDDVPVGCALLLALALAGGGAALRDGAALSLGAAV